MPSWLTIILALGGSAMISSVVGFFIARVLRQAFEKKDLEQEEKKRQEEQDKVDLENYRYEKERQKQYEDIKQLFKPVEEKIDSMSAVLEATSEGTLASLRNDILTLYYKCYDKGFRNDYDYQNAHDLYNAYLKLHGNSFIFDVMNRFDALPTKEAFEQNKKKVTKSAKVNLATITPSVGAAATTVNFSKKTKIEEVK